MAKRISERISERIPDNDNDSGDDSVNGSVNDSVNDSLFDDIPDNNTDSMTASEIDPFADVMNVEDAGGVDTASGKGLLGRIEDKVFGALRGKGKAKEKYTVPMNAPMNKQQPAPAPTTRIEPVSTNPSASVADLSRTIIEQAEKDAKMYKDDKELKGGYGQERHAREVSEPVKAAPKKTSLFRYVQVLIAVIAMAYGSMAIYSELPTHYMLVTGIVLTCFGSSALFARVDSP